MTKIRLDSVIKRKFITVVLIINIVITGIAMVLTTSILPAFAVGTCTDAGRCHTRGDYETTTRSGVEGNNKVFNHNFQNSNVNTQFAGVAYWMIFDSGNFIEIGWQKGKSSIGTQTTPWYYRFYQIGAAAQGAYLQQASIGATTLLKLEDTNADRAWIWWIGTQQKFALFDLPSTRATPHTGLESTDSNIGLTNDIMADVNNLKYYIGTSSFLWENIFLVAKPPNPTNPYYIETCANQNFYHYQIKKGSAPVC